MMRLKRPTLLEEQALSLIEPSQGSKQFPYQHYSDWIRIIRVGLRMTQAELAKRAGITQPHLAGIESGRSDPQVTTLRRIFDALECDVAISPRLRMDRQVLLENRARTIVRNRLRRVLGNMAMEGNTNDPDVFNRVLEKRVKEFLNDPEERLWKTQDD